MMLPGQRLYADQQIASGGSVLRYQGDGNLVLYAGPPGNAPWSSNAFDTGGRFEMQGDGNAVCYNAQDVPYWATNTYSPGARLMFSRRRLQIIATDGSVVWTGFEEGVEPQPEPGQHPDPLQGQVREISGAFGDATGPRNVCSLHLGDLIGQGLTYGLDHILPALDFASSLRLSRRPVVVAAAYRQPDLVGQQAGAPLGSAEQPAAVRGDSGGRAGPGAQVASGSRSTQGAGPVQQGQPVRLSRLSR